MNISKFRAWLVIEKEMVEVDSIDFVNEVFAFREDSFQYDHELKNAILMQSTGLTDKNGVEIFCDDILDFTKFDHNDHDAQYKGVVKFSSGEWQIWASPESEFFGSNGAFHLFHTDHQDDEMLVIGNIHQHKELLNV
jgi:uncharacterized phage protein (TIGR01671 family)